MQVSLLQFSLFSDWATSFCPQVQKTQKLVTSHSGYASTLDMVMYHTEQCHEYEMGGTYVCACLYAEPLHR